MEEHGRKPDSPSFVRVLERINMRNNSKIFEELKCWQTWLERSSEGNNSSSWWLLVSLGCFQILHQMRVSLESFITKPDGVRSFSVERRLSLTWVCFRWWFYACEKGLRAAPGYFLILESIRVGPVGILERFAVLEPLLKAARHSMRVKTYAYLFSKWMAVLGDNETIWNELSSTEYWFIDKLKNLIAQESPTFQDLTNFKGIRVLKKYRSWPCNCAGN